MMIKLIELNESSFLSVETKSASYNDDPDSFIIGDRVWVQGIKPGYIVYIGEVQFAKGDWVGVVLDKPEGKNDGSVRGG